MVWGPSLRGVLAIVALAGVMLAGTALARGAGAGDGITISVSPGARVGQVYNVRISGSSHHRALAALFIDYGGCARTYAGERRRARHAALAWAIRGSFAELSGWRSSSSGTDHACAYLVVSGRQLASAQRAFRIR